MSLPREPPPDPALDRRIFRPWDRPEAEYPAAVPVGPLRFGRTEPSAIAITCVLAYSNGFEFFVTSLLPPDGPGFSHRTGPVLPGARRGPPRSGSPLRSGLSSPTGARPSPPVYRHPPTTSRLVRSSTRPRSTADIRTPSVDIIAWRPKLSRTRAAIASKGSSRPPLPFPVSRTPQLSQPPLPPLTDFAAQAHQREGPGAQQRNAAQRSRPQRLQGLPRPPMAAAAERTSIIAGRIKNLGYFSCSDTYKFPLR